MSSNLSDKVFDFTDKNALFSAPCHVLLALSGGADSMALLHILTHWKTSGLRVSAVHINHGLRGSAADCDEHFVRNYCKEHGIALTVFYADVAARAQQEHLSVEEAGRRIRYDWFELLRCRLDADYILTAHTASDQAETVLMHLIRGCGVDGLCGIPAKRGNIRRPLLCADRREVEAYCAFHNVPFVTDETNEDTKYTRNYIRHRVLPLLREVNPSVDKALLRLSSCATVDASYINEQAEAALDAASDTYAYRLSAFVEQPVAVRRRMIRRLLSESQVGSFEESHITAADEIVLRRAGSVSLSDGYVFQVQQGMVFIRKSEPQLPSDDTSVNSLPTLMLFGQTELDIFIEDDANVHKKFVNCIVDYDKIQGALHLRCRRMGDYIHPAGRGVGKSVKKLMNEWRIPSHLRDHYPILCDELGIVLIPGYACDERVRTTEATKHFLVCKIGTEQG